MGKINYGRVVIGGLLAGLVITIGEFLLNGLFVADQWMAYAQEHNLPEETTWMMIMWILLNFLFGIAVVLLYAMMRPRCGAGPKTAAQAGLFIWFVAWLLCFGGVGLGFGFPGNLILITLIWGLVEVVLAALAGGWAYQEEEPAASAE